MTVSDKTASEMLILAA